MAIVAKPTTKVIIAISLFVVVAIVFDATINGGSWTERASKQKPASKARPIHPTAP